MITFESNRMRRIVGRLERGESVLVAFRQLAQERRITTGFIAASGSFTRVALCEVDQVNGALGAPWMLDGPCEVLSLVGNISMHDGGPSVVCHATVASRGDDGHVQVHGGRVQSAEVYTCEFVVECCDDLGLRRELDADTGLAQWVGLSTPAAPPPRERSREGPTSPSWAQAAAVSAQTDAQQERGAPSRTPLRVEGATLRFGSPPRPPAGPGTGSPARSARRAPRVELGAGPGPGAQLAPAPPVPGPLPQRKKTTEEEFFEEPIPEVGDFVDHKQFGLCRVDGEDPDGGLIIRLPSGVRRTIRLDYMVVEQVREEDGRRIYPLRPRRR